MIYDVIIIGAGPCGLAAAARLRESTPSALFTDAEHARYWRRSDHARSIEKEDKRVREGVSKASNSSSGRDINEGLDGQPSMLVLDATSDQWLSLWNSRFRTLSIDDLRSPLFFHCDPRDRDGLLEFAYAKGRSGELQEIQNVVGREQSKHQQKKKNRRAGCQCASVRHLDLDNRDTIDYFTPSSSVFHDYCGALVLRYHLDPLVHNARVSTVEYGDAGIPTETRALFKLTTTSNQTYFARTVILATGPGTEPRIPAEYNALLALSGSSHSLSHIFDPLHSTIASHLSAHVRSILVDNPSRPIEIAVVGGGLTSAQLIHLLLSTYTKSNNLKVHLILRSALKVKHFDVDLPWVSKFRNRNMAEFWSADSDKERFEMLKQARNGGSMPSRWAKLLRKYEKAGKLEIHNWTKIVPDMAQWDDLNKTWNLELQCDPPFQQGATRSGHSALVNNREDRTTTRIVNLPLISHVFFATGLPPDIDAVSCLASLREEHPIPSVNGLPQLNEDLMWNDEVPLFVTGALAGLRLGPGAGNLAGARLGAERVAWGVQNVLASDGNIPNQKGRRATISGRRKNRHFGVDVKNQAFTPGHTADASDSISSRKTRSGFNTCSESVLNSHRSSISTLASTPSDTTSRSASLSSASSVSSVTSSSPRSKSSNSNNKNKRTKKKGMMNSENSRAVVSTYTRLHQPEEPDHDVDGESDLDSDASERELESEDEDNDDGDGEEEGDGHQDRSTGDRRRGRQAIIDRSEFTGGFHNQFDALQTLCH